MGNNSLIEINPDNRSFILKIDSGLCTVGVDRIIGFNDHLDIDFLYEKGIMVNYPNDLLKAPEEVQLALLNSYLRLPNYAVKRISEYFHEHVYEIEEGVAQLNVV